MKKILAVVLVVGLAVSVFGCAENKTRIGEGAAIGGGAGALIGGLTGGWEGAAIGTAAGAATGALIGAQIDKQPKPAATTETPAVMTVQQVADLTKQGVKEDVIIEKIKLSDTKLSLTQADIASLKAAGVSQKVIDALQAK